MKRILEGVFIIVLSLTGMVDAICIYGTIKKTVWLHLTASGAAIYEGVIFSLLLLTGIASLAIGFSQRKFSSTLRTSFHVKWFTKESVVNFMQRKDVMTYIALMFYAVLILIIGYGVATFVFYTAAMCILGVGLLKSLVASAGMSGASYLLFVSLANIPFPRGLFW